jgi:hypothetical protein
MSIIWLVMALDYFREILNYSLDTRESYANMYLSNATEEKKKMSDNTCKQCEKFFERFRCNAPCECDCPKCSGLCECGLDEQYETAILDSAMCDNFGFGADYSK